MKTAALLLFMSLSLLGCATGPTPVQVLEVCPKVPPLALDVPARAWQQEMRDFLRGMPRTPPDYSLRSMGAALSTKP